MRENNAGPTYRVTCEGQTYNGATLYQAISLALDRHGSRAELEALEVWDHSRVSKISHETIKTWRTFYRENRL